MHHSWLWGFALLVLAGTALAQEPLPPTASCDGLAPDSFEAAVLGCEQATGSTQPYELPQVLEVIDEAPSAGLLQHPEVLRLGQSDGLVAELEATASEVVRLSSREAGAAPIPGSVLGQTSEPAGQPAALQISSIPDAQIPPPGTCRVWFPQRHSGLQRPPTSCDAEVPVGAVLIGG